MNFFEALLLGIIQGITEFLPISSDGHLVLVEYMLGVERTDVFFEVVVHFGTLFSILVVFKDELLKILSTLSSKETRTQIAFIILGTIPIGIVGTFFKTDIEGFFHDMNVTAGSFLFTGIVLIATGFVKKGKTEINWIRSFVIGLLQPLALLPGLSRSGITISTGLLLKVQPGIAASFSFLLAIPAILGAVTLTSFSAITEGIPLPGFGPMVAGFLSAFVVGIFSLKSLITVLKKGKFHWFGVYCIVIGIVTFLISMKG